MKEPFQNTHQRENADAKRSPHVLELRLSICKIWQTDSWEGHQQLSPALSTSRADQVLLNCHFSRSCQRSGDALGHEAEPQAAGESLLAGPRSPWKGREGQLKAKGRAWGCSTCPPRQPQAPPEALLMQDQIPPSRFSSPVSGELVQMEQEHSLSLHFSPRLSSGWNSWFGLEV